MTGCTIYSDILGLIFKNIYLYIRDRNFYNFFYFSSDGLQKLYFGEREVYIVFYAYGRLYDWELELVVKRSNCEGLVEPIFTCPVNMKKALKKFVAYPTRNYDFYCGHIKYDWYYHIIITKINKCLIVQFGLNDGSRITVYYEIRGHLNVHFTYAPVPIFRDSPLTTVSDDIKLAYGTQNMTIKSNVSLNVSKYIQDIVYLTVSHVRVPEYHNPMVAMKLQNIIKPPKCAQVNETTHYNNQPENMQPLLQLDVISLCWKGTYRWPGIYLFDVKIAHLTITDTYVKPIIYIAIHREAICSATTWNYDIVHFSRSSLQFSQAYYITKSKLLVQEVDMGTSFIYGKDADNNCTQTTIHYNTVKVHLLTRVLYVKARRSVIEVSNVYERVV